MFGIERSVGASCFGDLALLDWADCAVPDARDSGAQRRKVAEQEARHEDHDRHDHGVEFDSRDQVCDRVVLLELSHDA